MTINKNLKKGITVCLICHNEEYWLRFTLPDMVKYSDKVVIIDGSPFGPSDDNSEKIIRSIIRPTDVYIRGKFGCERNENNKNWNIVMRNEYLKYVNTTHMLLVDADEAYLPEDWQKFRNYINKRIAGLRYPYIHFYMDTNHILKGHPVWDSLCHHFTIYRPGFKYTILDTKIKDDRGLALVGRPEMITDNSIRLFHYNRLSPSDVYKMKQAKFKKRFDGGGLSDEEYDVWFKNWKDDRALDYKYIRPWSGKHPLEGKI